MSLKDQLQADLKTAMLNKQELRRDVIRFTQAALKNAELAKQQKLVKERSHLWQTGEVNIDNERIINEVELAKQRAEIDKLMLLTDEEQLAVLTTEVKRRRETIADAEKAGRADLLKQEQAELEVVLAYLPKQLSREEVVALAQKVVAEVGAQGPADTGKVMGKLMPQLKGKADGKMISEVVKELLTN
ncbi:MAG TPA: GatB/YqeY domain-containing protein [Anaerolineae bacterium]|nr:GatB/YqeY domain-containing protein [Anaerolineae bacterium]